MARAILSMPNTHYQISMIFTLENFNITINILFKKILLVLFGI